MKYISLIIFILALAWTWHVVHTESDISLETHASMQEQVAQIIVSSIKAKRPSATDVVIEKIWTETVSPTKVRAKYIYSFKDTTESGAAISEISGEGTLERQPDDGSGKDHWKFTKDSATNEAVQFEDATVVTGSPNGSTEETTKPAETTNSHPETSAPAEHKEEHQ